MACHSNKQLSHQSDAFGLLTWPCAACEVIINEVFYLFIYVTVFKTGSNLFTALKTEHITKNKPTKILAINMLLLFFSAIINVSFEMFFMFPNFCSNHRWWVLGR